MAEVIEFGDAERMVIDFFNAAYTGAIASRKPTTITTKPPSTSLTDTQTWLQVTVDGTPLEMPIIETPTVRVVYYTAAGSRTEVKRGASLAFGLLDTLSNTKRLVGRSGVIEDPDTNNLMCWFTYRVSLRPIPVAL